ncbi:AbiH family protein [Chryseobacterium aquaticum]|uniref:AbiH family protein n=1 Tax=Chryseobacterium aquaticum TaxID=452084 RepID=UPI0009F8FD92|nr:AbiH family protein [Chryseobacterium aquaticum]
MNRLILVGNGFDLAHNLKTGYKDFIDNFWSEQIKSCTIDSQINSIANDYFYFDLDQPLPVEDNFKNYNQLKNLLKQKKVKINFDNKFLKMISEAISTQNWVDIENEYYTELSNVKTEKYPDYKIDRLNSDFNDIKKLLADYLNRIDKKVTKNNSIFDKIYDRFYYQDLEEKKQLKLLEYISKIFLRNFNDIDLQNDISLETNNLKKRVNEINEEGDDAKEFIKSKIDSLHTSSSKELFNLNPDKILFLNFNYTETIKIYENKYKSETINIHGELNSLQNPIIFGFGDDVDKKYQEFEDLNDNKYLENFKSIAYLQTNSYKRLLEFINADEYQVFTFGHSCGISDRTMLNTIFEHENCKSIKPFYYKRKDGSDNYTDIVQTISRNFNDKKKFRDRVVNKTYCQPLT